MLLKNITQHRQLIRAGYEMAWYWHGAFRDGYEDPRFLPFPFRTPSAFVHQVLVELQLPARLPSQAERNKIRMHIYFYMSKYLLEPKSALKYTHL